MPLRSYDRSYDRLPRRPSEPVLASRLIIDLDGFDVGFTKAICNLFRIDEYTDGKDSEMLRGWIAYCVRDIIDLFTTNPQTLFGTIQIGPDLKALIDQGMDPERFVPEDIEEFQELYKAFAVNVYYVLNRKLDRYISKAIDMGYSDVSCDVHRYAPNMVVLNLRAIGRIV